MVGAQPDPKALEHAFRLEVFKMLKKESKISDAVIDNMLSWHNSGFNIFCSRPTDSNDQSGLGWLAQLVSHIPGKGEQMVRYYGYYSNKSRGMSKKADLD